MGTCCVLMQTARHSAKVLVENETRVRNRGGLEFTVGGGPLQTGAGRLHNALGRC